MYYIRLFQTRMPDRDIVRCVV